MKNLFKSLFNKERGTNDECNDFIIGNLGKLQLIGNRNDHTFHVTGTDKYVIFYNSGHYNIYENKKPIIINNKIVNFGYSVAGQSNKADYLNKVDLHKGKIIEDWFITNYPKQTTQQLVDTVFEKKVNTFTINGSLDLMSSKECDKEFIKNITINNDGTTFSADLDLSNWYQPINIYTENGLEVLNSDDFQSPYYIKDGTIRSCCHPGSYHEYIYYINRKIAEEHLSIILKNEFDSYFSVIVKGDTELEKQMFDFFVEFHDYKKTLQFYNSVVK